MVHALKPKFFLSITFGFLVFSLFSILDLPSLAMAQTDTRDINSLINEGIALYEQGQYEDAITYYDKALEIDPNDIDALNNKELALSNLGDIEKHDNASSISIAQTNSDNIEELIDQGNTLYEQGQYQEAITYYDKVLAYRSKSYRCSKQQRGSS